MKNLENTIRNLYKINQDIVIKEDGHVDVASSIRKCKTAMEDASQIMNKLKTMDPEGSLPTWWTNKLAVACMSLNKLRDYIVTSAESVTEKKHLDPVNPKAVKKKFDDRKDKDIDNDGDVDSSDKYLHKRRKAISKAVKGEAKKEKKDDVEINPKMDDMREKVQIPDKMKKKMDKIVKALKKSVGAHAKQAKTIGKMTSMDKPDDIQEKHGGDHVSTGRKDKKPWEDHLSFIENLNLEKKRTILLGDFNQNIPKKSQPKVAYTALKHFINGMDLLTSNMGLIHIVVSNDLKADNVQKILTGSNSDHNGISCSIKIY